MAKNVYRFRKLKRGDPEKPWLKRGSPLPPLTRRPASGAPAPERPATRPRPSFLDSPWLILGGSALAFGLGLLLFAGS